MPNTPKADEAKLPTQEEFAALVAQANHGDDDAVAQLRDVLDKHDVLWRTFGDLGKHAQLALIRAIANGDMLVQESVTRMADELCRELMGPYATKLEEMAIERIVTGWLEMRFVETAYPSPTAEEREIPLSAGETFPPIRSSGKACWWRLKQRI